METPDLIEFVQAAQAQLQNIKTCLAPAAQHAEPTSLRLGLAARQIDELAARAHSAGTPEFVHRVEHIRQEIVGRIAEPVKLHGENWLADLAAELRLLEKHLALLENFALN